MITNISIVSVFVKDVDESQAFYTEILGFEPRDDITLGEGYRWCTVVHPNQPELMVNLSVPGPPLAADLVEAMKRAQDEGGLPGLGLRVDDCQRTYEELSAKGVEFLQKREAPVRRRGAVRDNSGNWLVLVEPSEYSPPTSPDRGRGRGAAYMESVTGSPMSWASACPRRGISRHSPAARTQSRPAVIQAAK